ncbi:MAG: hypothetical protein M1835_000086 [Candelina submexicana]|nr:MAG: hypothetical protein M1835_000086 [Candelina submexicana]
MSQSARRLETGAALVEERDVRVEDYLNDKLQTVADLENLDSLLLNVQNQQDLLKKQLVEAEATLTKANDLSKNHNTDVLRQAEAFTKQQADIDRRLLIVTRSETSDDAVERFEGSMEKLRRLEIAEGYVELLRDVDSLSSEARRDLKASPRAALGPYVRLQKLTTALQAAQPAAEGAAPHLIDHVSSVTQKLGLDIRKAFSEEFEATLSKLNWPRKDISVVGAIENDWQNGTQNLLELQRPELEERESKEAKSDIAAREAPALFPLEVMVKPLELRFRYHFDGDRATNRVDKPEYFLSHIIGLLDDYNDILFRYLQPVLRDAFKGSDLALNPLYTDSTSALITSLLPMLRRKVFSLLPQVAGQPQLLSHLIHELIRFDTDLRDDWGYDAGQGTDGWKGLTWEVLVIKDWFGRWLQVEKDFALSRYREIIGNPESGEIDYDSTDPGTTKPTKAAIRVNDLLETITDRYKPLASFSQKLSFLLDIQIAIFDKFHERLHSSLEAYLSMTSSIARTVQGVSKEDQASLQGVRGLDRLCRVYGSAEYLEKAMSDWSDDIFFLELWEELQDRAKARRNTGRNVAGPMTVEDVAERTSSSVGSHDDSGALFDETAGAYKRLRIRSEGIIVDLLTHNNREALKPYSRINPWSSLSYEASSSSSISVTAELDGPLQQLSTYLSFLAGVLAPAPLRRISRQLSLSMQTYLWDNVLIRHTFSSSGVAQLSRDLAAIWGVMDRYLGEGQGEIGMKKLREGVGLLGLPVKVSRDEDGRLGLWEVEKMMFRSNEGAREVLDKLGLTVLTESEARHVLERRVELGS